MITYGARIINDNGYHVRFSFHAGQEGSHGLAASEVCLRKDEFEDMVKKLNMAVIRVETFSTEDFKKQFKEQTGFDLPEPGKHDVIMFGEGGPERDDLAAYLKKEGLDVGLFSPDDCKKIGESFSREPLKGGDKVRFIEKDPTTWSVSKDNAAHLTLGECYTVEKVEIHSWHTRVFLKEFPGIEFNSVWFELVIE